MQACSVSFSSPLLWCPSQGGAPEYEAGSEISGVPASLQKDDEFVAMHQALEKSAAD